MQVTTGEWHLQTVNGEESPASDDSEGGVCYGYTETVFSDPGLAADGSLPADVVDTDMGGSGDC
jgi:hypothetical protein